MGHSIAIQENVRRGWGHRLGELIVVMAMGSPLIGGKAALGDNQPPVADAGADRYMKGSVVLDGTGSYDPDPGNSLSYE